MFAVAVIPMLVWRLMAQVFQSLLLAHTTYPGLVTKISCLVRHHPMLFLVVSFVVTGRDDIVEVAYHNVIDFGSSN